MKILFLDHQGVIYLKKHPNVGILDDFNKEAVSVLNEILKDTTANLVVSSDWKLWVGLDEMRQFYLKQGIIKAPIDYTPKYEDYNMDIYPKQRSVEILGWLAKHPEVTQWVAVDDLDMREYLTNFVYVQDTQKGIINEEIKTQIKQFIAL